MFGNLISYPDGIIHNEVLANRVGLLNIIWNTGRRN
jgi:hypothetical protein